MSPYENQTVTLHGVVTGRLASRNAAGIVYYTLFVQNTADQADGDAATSDGIAVFFGRRAPALTLGDEVVISGRVTEYYGLTEIDAAGLSWQRLAAGRALPPPVWLTAADLAGPLEAWEGMRVGVGAAAVVGPTQAGCSLAVQPAPAAGRHAWRDGPPVLEILHTTNASCRGFPALAVGAEGRDIVGPLTYHFAAYKLVLAEPARWKPAPPPRITPATPAGRGQISVATLNLENYFDAVDDTGSDAEPKPAPAAIAARQAQFVALIAGRLNCPTLLAVQEVETRALLTALAAALVDRCGFEYTVSHLDSPDPRGIDVALLSDPRRVDVIAVSLWQQCTARVTGLVDPAHACPPGRSPLFARPPLLVELTVDDRPAAVMVNHFKSKRGGAAATASWRLAQAEAVAGWADARLAADPAAALIVLGDFNDHWQSPPLLTLTAPGRLFNTATAVPAPARYTYVYAGVAEMIDGILLSPYWQTRLAAAAVVHAHADFPAQRIILGYEVARPTDHDVMTVLLNVEPAGAAPVVSSEPTPVGPPGSAGGWLPFLIGAILVGIALRRRLTGTAGFQPASVTRRQDAGGPTGRRLLTRSKT